MVMRRRNIEKIASSKKRDVTFSKRRKGLFQKASDLCMLCDAHIAIIVFSRCDKPFVFGHSSITSVINHFLNETVPTGGATTTEHTTISHQIKEGEALLKKEKEGEALLKKDKAVDLDEWFKIDENPSLEELKSLHDELVEVRENVMKSMGMANSVGGSSGDTATFPGSSAIVVHNETQKFTDYNGNGAWNFNGVYQNLAVVDDTAKTSDIHEEVPWGRRKEDSALPPLS